jgi:hypothetical protein
MFFNVESCVLRQSTLIFVSVSYTVIVYLQNVYYVVSSRVQEMHFIRKYLILIMLGMVTCKLFCTRL